MQQITHLKILTNTSNILKLRKTIFYFYYLFACYTTRIFSFLHFLAVYFLIIFSYDTDFIAPIESISR